MLTFQKDANRLLLSYTPEGSNSAEWVDTKLEKGGTVVLKRTFSFSATDLVDDDTDTDSRTFVLGDSDTNYYRIKADKLGLKHDLLLWKQMRLGQATFIAPTDISIFSKIDDLTTEPIVVGGEKEGALPLADFQRLQAVFPTTTELKHYARARLSRVLSDYFGSTTAAETAFNSYLNNKVAKTRWKRPLRSEPVREYELNKFRFVRDELVEMLKDSDSYAESTWQQKILDLLLLLFPKYVAVLEHVQINDYYSSPKKTTKRFIDLMFVDANGSIDIVEIKKPFNDCVLSKTKYRDNFTPKAELAGSVMQVEKYLFHLSKWGRDGEEHIKKRHEKSLPKDAAIKISNPKGLILLGRDKEFSADQKFDFEIIRRKYTNIMDVMTYDDLLRRVDAVITRLQKTL